MKRTEHEDRAIDALIAKSLLAPMEASEASDADIAAFLNDNTELKSAETEMLRRIDPTSQAKHKQSNGSENIVQFPGAWQREQDELQIMAAARGQDEDITDEARMNGRELEKRKHREKHD